MNVEVIATEIVQSSRILAKQGVLDAFGHVSKRSSLRPDHFHMSRSLAPALVTSDDVLELDLDGCATSSPGARLFLERYIHAEIYRARPDVIAIVHSHAPDVVPFTIVPGASVRPVCHVCGFLSEVAEPFDVADYAGPASDLLVSNPFLGRQFASHMGRSAVGLMRAHGFTTVGGSLAEAVFNAVYTMRNCRIDLAARLLGEPTYLSAEEASACAKTTSQQADRAWALWAGELCEDH